MRLRHLFPRTCEISTGLCGCTKGACKVLRIWSTASSYQAQAAAKYRPETRTAQPQRLSTARLVEHKGARNEQELIFVVRWLRRFGRGSCGGHAYANEPLAPLPQRLTAQQQDLNKTARLKIGVQRASTLQIPQMKVPRSCMGELRGCCVSCS